VIQRKHIFYIIGILVLIIILLYLQCQGRREISPPPEKVEEPVQKPSAVKPEITRETIKPEKEIPPAEEKVAIPQEDPEVSVPETQLEKVEEGKSKPEEKPLVVLQEKPAEEVAPPEEKLIAIIPAKVIEKPSEIITRIPEKPIEKNHKSVPVIQIEPTADPARRIAILPFDNLTDNPEAVNGILPWIIDRLEERGLDVVDEDITSEVLCRERIRLATDLPKDVSRKVGNTLKAGTILAGTIFSYKTDKNPRIGISARLIDTATGYITWANYASDTGEDFTGLLGLGTIKSIHKLVPKVVDKLLASFHIEHLQSAPESMYKVAVLPFHNLSKARHAGMIVTRLFLVELFKNKLFDPVEYGDVRKMIVDLRVRHKGEINYNKLNDFSRSLNVGIILTGTVEDFSEGIANVYPPKVAISARLLDGRENKIVWFNALELDGEDKITAFEWGKIRSPDKVAYAIVSDLVENMEKAKWH
jgi:TolB-like protein